MNSQLFTKRLQEILDYYNLTASAFAERLGVGRSSISHIISGRNKPSLDFVMHIVENFREVKFEWLLQGKGVFPASATNNNLTKLIPEETPATPVSNTKQLETSIKTEEKDLFTSVNINKKTEKPSVPSKTIERIVIFYTDQSFKEYKNEMD